MICIGGGTGVDVTTATCDSVEGAGMCVCVIWVEVTGRVAVVLVAVVMCEGACVSCGVGEGVCAGIEDSDGRVVTAL